MSSLAHSTTYQLFDRAAMGKLWEARETLGLDATTVSNLDALWSNRKKGTVECCTPITYKFPKNSLVGEAGYGRLYGSKGCLGHMEKSIRATLAHKFYDDVDMVLAHPTIALHLAARYNIEMPSLAHYVANRESLCATHTDLKLHVNALLNGGRIPAEAKEIPILPLIYKECSTWYMTLYLHEHFQVLKRLTAKRDNPKGSFIAAVLQTEERKCLEALVKCLREHGLSVDVLVYDGCMVRKSSDLVQHLPACEAAILDATGIAMRLKIKPMDDDVLQDLDTLASPPLGEAYESMKARWETEHSFFVPSGTICKATATGLTQMSLQHVADITEPWKCVVVKDGKETLESFFKTWRQDPTRRTTNTISTKMPKDCGPDEISAFRGFAYEQVPATPICEEAIRSFQTLVRCCAGDTDPLYEYLLKSIARMIQNPLQKSNVCVILSSRRQGSGKDTLMGWIATLMGRHNVAHYSSEDEFWSPYDTKKEGAVMVHLEEASPGENQRRSDALKARITQEFNSINPKGVRAYQSPNISSYFMTTNNSVPVKLEATDRRFLILNPSDACYKMGAPFWDLLYQNMASPAWMHSIGTYLATLDLTGFKPTTFPSTEIRDMLLEIVEEDKPATKFIKQWRGVDQSADELYNDYKEWSENEGVAYLSKIGLTKHLAFQCKDYFASRLLQGRRLYSFREVAN